MRSFEIFYHEMESFPIEHHIMYYCCESSALLDHFLLMVGKFFGDTPTEIFLGVTEKTIILSKDLEGNRAINLCLTDAMGSFLVNDLYMNDKKNYATRVKITPDFKEHITKRTIGNAELCITLSETEFCLMRTDDCETITVKFETVPATTRETSNEYFFLLAMINSPEREIFLDLTLTPRGFFKLNSNVITVEYGVDCAIFSKRDKTRHTFGRGDTKYEMDLERNDIYFFHYLENYACSMSIKTDAAGILLNKREGLNILSMYVSNTER